MDTFVVEMKDDNPDHAEDHLLVVLDDVAHLGDRKTYADVLHELKAGVDVGTLGIDVLGLHGEGLRVLFVVERPNEKDETNTVVKVGGDVLYGSDWTFLEVVVHPTREGLHLLADPLVFGDSAPAA